ncbi:MAG: VWA domain-containing protein [Alphaproteobacteria bacterium]
MVELIRPWALFLLPLPLLAWQILPAHPPRAALLVPDRLAGFLHAMSRAKLGAGAARRLPLAVAALGWLALVLALAAPVTKGDPLHEATGRDLLLALDLSASMEARDVELDGRRVDRFTAIKALAGAFIRGREGDRVGLIVFGEETYLVAPLTYDVQAVEGFLDEVTIGMPGRKTAIGNAIGLAIRTLEAQPASSRVLILLSDGDSNAGSLGPKTAAEFATEHHVTIHTIGFGKVSTEGYASETASDDYAGLKDVAEITGGRHFLARTTDALRSVYAELDLLEPTEASAGGRYAERDWVTELLVVALLALAALTVLDRRFGRI